MAELALNQMFAYAPVVGQEMIAQHHQLVILLLLLSQEYRVQVHVLAQVLDRAAPCNALLDIQ